MTLTPEQQAVAEQAERETAFARARRKLLLATSEFERSRPAVARAARYRTTVWLCLACLFFTALWLGGMWAKPEMLDLSTWADQLTHPLAVLGPPLGALLVCLVSWTAARRNTLEHGPELAIARFFAHFDYPVKTEGVAWDVVTADFDHSRRRTIPFAVSKPLPAAIRNADDLELYWKDLCRYDGRGQYWISIDQCDVVSLTPVLKLAKLRITFRRTTGKLLAYVAIGALGGSIGVWTDNAKEFLGAPLTYLALGALFSLAGAAASKFKGKQVLELHCQKLVIKCGENWRMFNGEWEGWEEADLSWLDDPTVREIAAHPVSTSASRR